SSVSWPCRSSGTSAPKPSGLRRAASWSSSAPDATAATASTMRAFVSAIVSALTSSMPTRWKAFRIASRWSSARTQMTPAGVAIPRRPLDRSPPALGRSEQRDADRGERNRDDELDQPTDVEDVRQDAAEEARRDPDERRCEQADVLSAGKHEPPQCADH